MARHLALMPEIAGSNPAECLDFFFFFFCMHFFFLKKFVVKELNNCNVSICGVVDNSVYSNIS